MLADIRLSLVIARREVRDQFRDWRVIFPILGITVFFPFLMNFTANQLLDFVRQYGASIVGERLIPFLLMIVGFFPISVSLVIALESFVGEKERGSIEPLLNTPLKDWQLYTGKLLSSTVPPLVSSFLGMGVYVAGLIGQGIPLPEADLILLIIVLTVVQAFVMVSGAVVVSTQATSVRAANLLASIIIIPMALLIQGESVIMFWGDYRVLWLIILGLIALCFLLMRVGLAHFQREELLGREIDVLNVRWMWRVFWQAFTGGAKSLGGWYRVSVGASLRLLKVPMLVMLLMVAVGIGIGLVVVGQFSGVVPAEAVNLTNPGERVDALLSQWGLFSTAPVLSIFWQNLRALLLTLVLGVFSMGILSPLPILGTMAITGGLLGIIAAQGGSPLLFLAGLILPHGIIEIPAAMLACAAVLRIGVMFVTPTPGRTVGEVLIATIAEWAKVMIGVVVPLLFIAAIVETWITPRIAWLIFR